MGYIEKRGKNSWRLYTQVNVAGQMQPVRVTLRMDPSLPESTQRRDAQRELRLLEARLAGASSDVPTLQQWSDSWLANMDPETSPVTVANYKYLLSSRILPQLGPLPLPDLTPTRLTEWLRAIRTDPRKSTRKEEKDLSRPRRKGEKLIPASRQAKPLSAKTVSLYYGCLHAVLEAAVRAGHLEYNPMDRVESPKQRKKKKPRLPESDVIYLLRLIVTEAPMPLRLSVLLAMLCSLRLGEVGALKYTAIDWDAGTITIDKALKYTPATGAFIEAPKTDAGDRVITLPPAMIKILHDALWDDVVEAQDDPEKWRGDNWIVHSRHGARVNKDTPSKWFRAFADAHGYQNLTFHGLRHLHASLLIAMGVDIPSVSARMGHSDPAITLRAYADMLPAQDQTAATAMDQLLIQSMPAAMRPPAKED